MLARKIRRFLDGNFSQRINAFCKSQINHVKNAQEKQAASTINSDGLENLKADLITQRLQASQLVKFADELSPVDTIEISCRGEVITTSMALLKKIRGSQLEQMMSGKVAHGYDKAGRPFFNIEKAVFQHIIDYLRSDRQRLPPAQDATLLRSVEADIVILSLEKGLATPHTLTTKLAK